MNFRVPRNLVESCAAVSVASNDTDATQQQKAVPHKRTHTRRPRRTRSPAPAFGRPSPALLARADRGYARFLAQAAPDDRTADHDQDDAARHR